MLLAALLVVVLVAAAEIYVIIVIAHLIGGLLTAALLIVSTVGGLWLVRRERRRAGNALREALASGMMPDRELADAAVILGGGVLIAIPGFITDTLGLFAVAPFTRPAVRGLLTRWAARRAGLAGQQPPRASGGEPPPGGGGGQVIQGEVLQERTEQPGRAKREQDSGMPRRDGDR